MATVYLARDLKHDRFVALKVLHADLAAALGGERFLREIRLAARLQHPHVLSVHDSGDAAGQLWFTMPYVEGESLRARLERERQLSVADALRIAREAAEALDLRAPARRDPPRREAREHPPHRGPLPAGRLRDRPGAAGERPADRDRNGRGDAGLYEPGAGERGARARRAHRRLRPRLRAVRDAGGTPAVSREHGAGDRGATLARSGAAAARQSSRPTGRSRAGRVQGAGQDAR